MRGACLPCADIGVQFKKRIGKRIIRANDEVRLVLSEIVIAIEFRRAPLLAVERFGHGRLLNVASAFA